MKFTATLFLACIGLASLASTAQAQVVPIEITGTAVGNLITLEAYGEATGRHLGRCTFVITTVTTTDPEEEYVYDTYTAADGSTLTLLRVGLEFGFTETGHIEGIDYWEIVSGTGRFETAASAGEPLVSTFASTEPVLDPTEIPLSYVKRGFIDLGKKKKK